MKFITHPPSALLKPFIKHYVIIDTDEELINRVLPGTSLVMAFRYKGQVNYVENGQQERLATSMISGLRKAGRLIQYSPDTGNILVIFKEAKANAFLQEPLHELFNYSIGLDDLAGYQNVTILEEQLAVATHHEQRIALIERFLTSKLQASTHDFLVQAALEKIHASRGLVKIKSLADSLFISQDAFEKRFRRMVGVSPKTFAEVIRMRTILKRPLLNQPILDVAFEAGYFDQAHFSKAFKLFTGQTPSDFAKAPIFW